MTKLQLTKAETNELNFLKESFNNPTKEALASLDVQILNQFLIKKGYWKKSFRFLKKELKVIIFCNPKSKKAKEIIAQAEVDETIHNQAMSIQLKQRQVDRKKRFDRQKGLMSKF